VNQSSKVRKLKPIKGVPEVIRCQCFCGQMVAIGIDVETSEPCLAHDLPVCARYMLNEPLSEFVRALREHHAQLKGQIHHGHH